MLCGIPGESDSWYAEIAKWLPAIFHLQPPSGLNRVRYDRFSPYHFRSRDFGLMLQPSRAYRYVYALPNESLMRLAYSFEDSRDKGHTHRGLHSQPGQQELQEVLQEWNRVWRISRPILRIFREGQRLRIIDTRPIAHQLRALRLRADPGSCLEGDHGAEWCGGFPRGSRDGNPDVVRRQSFIANEWQAAWPGGFLIRAARWQTPRPGAGPNWSFRIARTRTLYRQDLIQHARISC